MGIDIRLPRLPKLGKRGLFSIILLIVLVNASVGYMYFEAKKSDITVLHIKGAPEGIVFIADPHLREENIDHTRQIIGEINQLHPSLVLIGGDFVYEGEDDFHFQDVWSGLDAPVYAVLGNHDYKSGLTSAGWIGKNMAVSCGCYDKDAYNVSCLRDNSTDVAYADRLAEKLEENGVRVLRNEYVNMNLNGTPLLLVGVDDGWAGMADPPEIPPTDAFTLYMIHEPECRADWDADLILSGHTHGGQFLPDNLPLPGKGPLSGLVERNGVRTYITRGIGTSNMAIELRLFATPEIVIINPTTPPEELFPGKKVTHITLDE
jgi:predicted MPP superfamily phosphohydrolase